MIIENGGFYQKSDGSVSEIYAILQNIVVAKCYDANGSYNTKKVWDSADFKASHVRRVRRKHGRY